MVFSHHYKSWRKQKLERLNVDRRNSKTQFEINKLKKDIKRKISCKKEQINRVKR
jgi:hypothetical protein